MGPSSINSHLVRCRGGEWIVGSHSKGFAVSPAKHPMGWTSHLSWNGKAWLNCSWPNRPAWLPVAWLCCEADPVEGPKFAAAILDAGPGDDADALIACDWLEETGRGGGLGVLCSRVEAKALLEELPQNWIRQSYPNLDGFDENYEAGGFGPLASWCRHLIATRCVACGGRREGEDRIKIENGMQPRRIKASGLKGCPAPCPLCGFPAHPTPPTLAIPEVVK